MKAKILAIASTALLAGCATWGQMDSGLSALKGQDIKVAFDVLGYPSQQQQFGEDTVYTWGSSHSGGMLLPHTTTTTGAVGTTPIRATTTSSQFVPMNYDCTIKLIAGPTAVVKKYEYDGNMGGCQRYIQQLNRAAKG